MKRVRRNRERPEHRTTVLVSRRRDERFHGSHDGLCDECAVLLVIVRRRERNAVSASDRT